MMSGAKRDAAIRAHMLAAICLRRYAEDRAGRENDDHLVTTALTNLADVHEMKAVRMRTHPELRVRP